MPSIHLEENQERGVIYIVVDGDPEQGQPWKIELLADSAYTIGNSMAIMALKIASTRGSFCKTLAGGMVPMQSTRSGEPRQRPFVEPAQQETTLAPEVFPEMTVETTQSPPPSSQPSSEG